MTRLVLLAGVVLLALLGIAAAAQDDVPRSLAFTVTSDELRLTRAGTTQAIRLRRDAVAVVGAGDTLTTDRFGRALVEVDGAALLIMPQSVIRFESIAVIGGITTVTIGVGGHAVYSGESESAQVVFDMTALDVTAHGAAAAWSDFEDGDIATVARGEVRYTLATTGGEAVLAAGSGIYVPSDMPRIESLTERVAFLHAAQMIGLLYGCPSSVVRTGGESLNLRVAPSLQASIIGYTDAGDDALVMGSSQGANWRRVQRFSGFGWMFAGYLENNCPDLRAYPNDTVERNLELIVVQPRELELLTPFYGTPDTNPWVYRSFRSSPYETAPDS